MNIFQFAIVKECDALFISNFIHMVTKPHYGNIFLEVRFCRQKYHRIKNDDTNIFRVQVSEQLPSDVS